MVRPWVKHFVCKKHELPVGEARSFVINGSTIPYILIRMENDEVRAYENAPIILRGFL
ncbi:MULTISPECIES: hypothetical protein [Mucilaginibacter]|uniref:Uncharacterized protein n=1 Tax=Mucilaginibacter rubeus TaxID=2027860 RepID=A0ABX7U787_9SPHI|nr:MULTISPECIES: hypothetical protein [Mucilaginibacter]QTE41176.1 hypothetical protein J3L19_19725 [Mucilaginibacter rubeus]QTE47780.1 hypothetical protein J3L21_19710 [Mucilaginibacter rubeus]QTE59171.1 hypothetical protein J3L23_11370 [Mucilaginibacter rubeus]QTE61369.1 hypothetical protein J3L22_22485 [Mucilaginibacter rubeus]QTF60127.1 hypothetical protein J3L20_22125 [Mucilaginibacter rubeus]